ncbi:MAG: copper resistance D family protein [Yoonia sp.]|jgi:putative copper resistance protein D|uniref:copper resistance D family protein n=1 Tax=unclassified Yoonia TaxID=2629118 RepID=UPI001EDD9CD6|nr:CopD family protein [Yoonia sp. I 8.24]MCG3269598.1 CopD family protein [Yoonia sp. I 8.24]
MDGLAPIDGWALLAIFAKAAGYAAALVAMGGPLFVATFRSAPGDVLRLARQLAVSAALLGLVVLALRFGIRSARISGMGLEGAVDPMMLGLVWDSPLGTAALWRGAGELLILAVLIEGTIGLAISLLGTLLVAVSYTLVGHSLGDPRWLLAALVGAHLLAGAFWVGALAPLHRAAGLHDGAALLHRFGIIASGTVAVLVLVGLTFAWLMIGSFGGLFGTAYGWTLIAKLVVITGLLGLAAKNKLRLVPSLTSNDSSAPDRLRRSIRMEIIAVALILLATATLTSITTPPVNL